MARSNFLEVISHDRKMLSEWFSNRREIFVSEASEGMFGRKVDASALRDEFRLLARELDPENLELEGWFETEADLLIHIAAKGLRRPTIDIQYVNMAFKKLERQLWNMQKKRDTKGVAIEAGSATGNAQAVIGYGGLDDYQIAQQKRVEQSNDTAYNPDGTIPV